MGFYADRFLPRFQDTTMDVRRLRALRARTCAGLHGQVVELGFGTGLNTAHYPSDVAAIFAIEPSARCVELAAPRIAASPAPVTIAGLTGERLDLPDGEFDAVLTTWTLCTIPDLHAALAEARRVLRPGGSIHFVEHGHAPDPAVARWQRRIEPVHKRIFGGCHLTRDIAAELTQAGFVLDHLDTFYMAKTPKLFGYTYQGRARRD
jgi:SAM-dependent methyltransferase